VWSSGLVRPWRGAAWRSSRSHGATRCAAVCCTRVAGRLRSTRPASVLLQGRLRDETGSGRYSEGERHAETSTGRASASMCAPAAGRFERVLHAEGHGAAYARKRRVGGACPSARRHLDLRCSRRAQDGLNILVEQRCTEYCLAHGADGRAQACQDAQVPVRQRPAVAYVRIASPAGDAAQPTSDATSCAAAFECTRTLST
jgi:hypothetical protein